MENLTLEQLTRLSQQFQDPSLSIFLPTHRAGEETKKGPIRFKNLLREAELSLRAKGLGPREASALLQPAQALLADGLFWQYQREGLAVYLASDDFHLYHLPFRLPELLIVARGYYVKPILPLFTANGHYYILALSQQAVRLFEGTRHTVGQIDLPPNTPASLDEAFTLNDPETQLRFYASGSGDDPRSGVFHGQGPGEEANKERIERYLNLVDAGLTTSFQGAQAPLVLAGVDYLLPIYRHVSNYAHIMPTGITGSPEQLRPEELQAQAWPIVEPYFREVLDLALEQFQQLAGTGRATDNLAEVIAAAFQGRVDKLMVADDAEVWGHFEPDTGQVTHYQAQQSQEDDVALLDFAAMQTLQKSGHVYVLSQAEMPTRSPAAAVLRY
jgi:hypothetical protein